MAPGSGSSSRLSLRLPQPMPVIVEGEADPPAVPAKSPRRRTVNGNGTITPMSLGSMPQSSTDTPPDRTSEAAKEGIKDQKWVAKRGGWYRLVLGALLPVGLIVGLAVGLTVGLKTRDPPDPPSPPLPTGVFPAGSYSFTTALTNISTACTNNPSTWRCFPYSLFDPTAPTLSAATLYWIISPATIDTYVISSSDNPFAPSFANVSLALLDGGQDTERFTFQFTMAKAVTPSAPLNGSSEGEVDLCWFNSTVLSATIFTRKRATYPAGIGNVAAPVNASTVFAPWPFAIEVDQVQGAGGVTPQCLDGSGRVVGGNLKPNGSGGECQCSYVNYGLLYNIVYPPGFVIPRM